MSSAIDQTFVSWYLRVWVLPVPGLRLLAPAALHPRGYSAGPRTASQREFGVYVIGNEQCGLCLLATAATAAAASSNCGCSNAPNVVE